MTSAAAFISRFDADGNALWRTEFRDVESWRKPPLLLSDNDVAIVAGESDILRVSGSDGAERWRKQFALPDEMRSKRLATLPGGILVVLSSSVEGYGIREFGGQPKAPSGSSVVEAYKDDGSSAFDTVEISVHTPDHPEGASPLKIDGVVSTDGALFIRGKIFKTGAGGRWIEEPIVVRVGLDGNVVSATGQRSLRDILSIANDDERIRVSVDDIRIRDRELELVGTRIIRYRLEGAHSGLRFGDDAIFVASVPLSAD